MKRVASIKRRSASGINTAFHLSYRSCYTVLGDFLCFLPSRSCGKNYIGPCTVGSACVVRYCEGWRLSAQLTFERTVLTPAATIDDGKMKPGSKESALVRKVPSPFPKRTETPPADDVSLLNVTARSSFPSPSKSPLTTLFAPDPVAYCAGARKVPSPFPSNTETCLASAPEQD